MSLCQKSKTEILKRKLLKRKRKKRRRRRRRGREKRKEFETNQNWLNCLKNNCLETKSLFLGYFLKNETKEKEMENLNENFHNLIGGPSWSPSGEAKSNISNRNNVTCGPSLTNSDFHTSQQVRRSRKKDSVVNTKCFKMKISKQLKISPKSKSNCSCPFFQQKFLIFSLLFLSFGCLILNFDTTFATIVANNNNNITLNASDSSAIIANATNSITLTSNFPIVLQHLNNNKSKIDTIVSYTTTTTNVTNNKSGNYNNDDDNLLSLSKREQNTNICNDNYRQPNCIENGEKQIDGGQQLVSKPKSNMKHLITSVNSSGNYNNDDNNKVVDLVNLKLNKNSSISVDKVVVSELSLPIGQHKSTNNNRIKDEIMTQTTTLLKKSNNNENTENNNHNNKNSNKIQYNTNNVDDDKSIQLPQSVSNSANLNPFIGIGESPLKTVPNSHKLLPPLSSSSIIMSDDTVNESKIIDKANRTKPTVLPRTTINRISNEKGLEAIGSFHASFNSKSFTTIATDSIENSSNSSNEIFDNNNVNNHQRQMLSLASTTKPSFHPQSFDKTLMSTPETFINSSSSSSSSSSSMPVIVNNFTINDTNLNLISTKTISAMPSRSLRQNSKILSSSFASSSANHNDNNSSILRISNINSDNNNTSTSTSTTNNIIINDVNTTKFIPNKNESQTLELSSSSSYSSSTSSLTSFSSSSNQQNYYYLLDNNNNDNSNSSSNVILDDHHQQHNHNHSGNNDVGVVVEPKNLFFSMLLLDSKHSKESVVVAPSAVRTTKCPALPLDQHDIAWAQTDAGVLALQVCPEPYHGTVYRSCYRDGVWSNQTDLSECRLIPLRILQQLIYSHVRKHLIDDLVRLTIELQDLLTSPKTPLYCPTDRLQSLETLNAILFHVGPKKIRIEPNLEQTKKRIDFIQAIVTISEHLFIRTRALQFVSFWNINSTNLNSGEEMEMGTAEAGATYSVNNRQYQNILLRNKILDSIQGIRMLMENFVRALILAYEDGSIQQLANRRLHHHHHRQAPNGRIPRSWNTTSRTNNIAIQLSHLKLHEEIVFHLDGLDWLVESGQTISGRHQAPTNNRQQPQEHELPRQPNQPKCPFVTVLKRPLANQTTDFGEHWKFSVNVNDITHLGVGISNIWLKNMDQNFLLALDDATTVYSDLVIVSIVPAVSINVNFEIVPRFEIEFRIKSNIDKIESLNLLPNQADMERSNLMDNGDDGRSRTNDASMNGNNETNRVRMVDNGGQRIKSNQIECARIMGNQAISHKSQTLGSWSWTRDSCRTLWRNHHYIRCECSELGIIAAVQFSDSNSLPKLAKNKKDPTKNQATHAEDDEINDDSIKELKHDSSYSTSSSSSHQLRYPGSLFQKQKINSNENNNLIGQQVQDTFNNNNSVVSGHVPIARADRTIGFSHFHNRIINSIQETGTKIVIEEYANQNGNEPKSDGYYHHNNQHHRNNYHRRILDSGSANFVHLSHHFTLYFSLGASVLFLIATLSVQFRNRHQESRETFFILRNLALTLLMIQLTFLFGTTFHMDLFWIRVARLSPGANQFVETEFVRRSKHVLCLAVPIFLHFTHLASLFWMLSHSILLYQRFWKQIQHNQNGNSNSGKPVQNSNENNNSNNKLSENSRSIKNHHHHRHSHSHSKLVELNENQCTAPSDIAKSKSNCEQHLNVNSKHFRKRFLKQNRIKSILDLQKCIHHLNDDTNKSKRQKCPYHHHSHNTQSRSNNQNLERWNLWSLFRSLMKHLFYKSFHRSQTSLVPTPTPQLSDETNLNSKNEICLELNSTTMKQTEVSSQNFKNSLISDQSTETKHSEQTLCDSNLDSNQSSSSSSSSPSTLELRSGSNLDNLNNRTKSKTTTAAVIDHKQQEQQQQSKFETESNETNSLSLCRCLCVGCCYPCSNWNRRRSWKCHHYLSLSMGIPFVLVLTSYLLNPRGYETHRYCWMSIEGGIQYSFILPVLSLILSNTLLMLLILKRYFERKSLIHRSQIEKLRPSLRACIILLPFFTLNWFLSILSLEPLATSLFEHVFAFTNCLYSFLVWYFHSVQRYQTNYSIPARFIGSRIQRQFSKLFHLNQWRQRGRQRQRRLQQQLQLNLREDSGIDANDAQEFAWAMTSGPVSVPVVANVHSSSSPTSANLSNLQQTVTDQSFYVDAAPSNGEMSNFVANTTSATTLNHQYHHPYPHFHSHYANECQNHPQNSEDYRNHSHFYHHNHDITKYGGYQQFESHDFYEPQCSHHHYSPHVTEDCFAKSSDDTISFPPNESSDIETSTCCNSKCCKNSQQNNFYSRVSIENSNESQIQSTSSSTNNPMFNQTQILQNQPNLLFDEEDDDEEVVIVELDDDEVLDLDDEDGEDGEEESNDSDDSVDDDDDDTDDQQQMVIDYLRKNY